MLSLLTATVFESCYTPSNFSLWNKKWPFVNKIYSCSFVYIIHKTLLILLVLCLISSGMTRTFFIRSSLDWVHSNRCWNSLMQTSSPHSFIDIIHACIVDELEWNKNFDTFITHDPFPKKRKRKKKRLVVVFFFFDCYHAKHRIERIIMIDMKWTVQTEHFTIVFIVYIHNVS